jgi:hypothetical protein
MSGLPLLLALIVAMDWPHLPHKPWLDSGMWGQHGQVAKPVPHTGRRVPGRPFVMAALFVGPHDLGNALDVRPTKGRNP